MTTSRTSESRWLSLRDSWTSCSSARTRLYSDSGHPLPHQLAVRPIHVHLTTSRQMCGVSFSNTASPGPSSRRTTGAAVPLDLRDHPARVEQGAAAEGERSGVQGALPGPELQERQAAAALDHPGPAEEVPPGVCLDGVQQEAGVDLGWTLQVGEPRSRSEGREQVVEVQLLRVDPHAVLGGQPAGQPTRQDRPVQCGDPVSLLDEVDRVTPVPAPDVEDVLPRLQLVGDPGPRTASAWSAPGRSSPRKPLLMTSPFRPGPREEPQRPDCRDRHHRGARHTIVSKTS